MSVTEPNTGTKSGLTVTTEADLVTITSAGIYILHVDLVNMASGDITTFNAYEKVLSGSTEQLGQSRTYNFTSLVEKVAKLGPFTVAHSLRLSILQGAGTARSYDWSVVKIG